MPPKFDASKVDWNNLGVIYLFRYFSARFEEKEREDRQLKERIKQLEEINLPRQQSGSSQTGNTRSYNVRKYKDYPSTDSGKRAKGGFAYSTKFEITRRMPVAYSTVLPAETSFQRVLSELPRMSSAW